MWLHRSKLVSERLFVCRDLSDVEIVLVLCDFGCTIINSVCVFKCQCHCFSKFYSRDGGVLLVETRLHVLLG